MRKFIWLSLPLLWLVATPCFPQLTRALNLPRPDDDLTKYPISMSNPGKSGKDVLWDISQMKVARKKILQRYTLYPDSASCLVSTEQGTRYYDCMHGDSLLLGGYENNQSKVTFDRPEATLLFPMQYGDSTAGYFHGRGTYCDRLRIRSFGTYTLKADAKGRLVLPDGDTLRNVIRLHAVKLISCIYYPMDSTAQFRKSFSSDSIRLYQLRDTSIIRSDEYRWYVHGYRYPVLEYRSARANGHPGQATALAFYSPPTDQEALALDDGNIKARDNDKEKERNGTDNGQNGSDFHYQMTQNSAEGYVNIHYEADRQTDVTAILADTRGIVYKTLSQHGQTSGDISLSYNGLMTGQYIIYIKINGKTYAEKFNVK